STMIVVDTTMKILNINSFSNRQSEFKKSELLLKPLEELCSDKRALFDAEALTQLEDTGVWQGMVELYEQRVAVQVTAYTICNHLNNIEYYTLFLKSKEEILQEKSLSLYHPQVDALTQLPNRTHLLDKLAKIMHSPHLKREMIGLFFIEFDDLSRFNDTLGYDIDDKLIVQLSQSVQGLLDTHDMLARIGNNQFVIVVENIASEKMAKVMVQSLLHMLSEPFSIESNMFYISASIGISLFPHDADSAYTLLKSAENSMKRAQKDGKNHFAFTHNFMATDVCSKTETLMADLPAAIENGEIYFLLQPQYEHRKERYSGAEILARWRHPEYGEISPAIFISLAEQSGMIDSLTIKALMEVSKIFSILKEASVKDFSLSINISSYFLMKSNFIETIEFFMENYNLKGQKLNFEITEEMLTQNIDNLTQILDQIRKMGIKIEIDDYGTGFTSINYLANLPIDTLKIDRMFVSNIDKESKKWMLFKAIYDMARALGIDAIVEGVENSLENEVIKSFDDVTIQGYYYSKPISLEALLKEITT
ncbi:MAG: hypothetical protein DRG24_06655, partial [Epsilonproteobacteria bacterium]